MENGEKVVKGSLIFQKNFDEERDFEIFSFLFNEEPIGYR